jgi:hypothetical protein
MKRVTPSDLSPYTRSDLFRSGIIAAVWGLFYILLIAHAGVRSNGTSSLAEAAAPVSRAAADVEHLGNAKLASEVNQSGHR